MLDFPAEILADSFTIQFDFSDLDDSFAPVAARLPSFVGDIQNKLVFQLYNRLGEYLNEEDRIEQNLGQFSPIIFYGPGYSGKSCLAIAFAKRIVEQFGHRLASPKIIRVCVAEFCRDFGKSIYTQTSDDYLRRFETPGVILFEDLQKISGQPRAALQLEKLIDQFIDNGQIALFTSRSAPHSLSMITDRLASRISAGTLLPVNFPGPVGKQQIIEQLQAQFDQELSTDTIHSLSLRKNVSFADISQHFCHAKVNQIEAKSQEDPPRPGSFDSQQESGELVARILDIVCRRIDIDLETIQGSSRQKRIAFARNISIFMIRNKTQLSYQKIGNYFSGRDHSTVMHAYNKIASTQDLPEVVDLIEHVNDQLHDHAVSVQAVSVSADSKEYRSR